MIFVGWGNRKTKDFGEILPSTCPICNNKISYHLVRARDWADLFFIPIFPYQSGWFLLCPICDNGMELESKKDINLARELSEHAVNLSEKDYGKKIEEFCKKADFIDAE